MTGRDAFLKVAAWAEERAEYWQSEADRHRMLVGGSLHKIRHHGASRMAAAATEKMAIYRECAAVAHLLAAEEDNSNG